ncbi:MAG: hypothetical protein F4W89_10400 [Acidobacteria bacterium]|nr:hypothetical protein [Chloroflexota bacterium]MYD71136.1 hypothetical protein [Acidobacteriota bacterium]
MVMTQGWRVPACGVAAVLLATGVAPRPVAADEIQLSMDAGRVTLIAAGTPLTDVLAAWSRVGGTRFVDAEAMAGESVTLHLVDVTESEALRVLLRPAVGYVAAPRRAGSNGISRYDRVKILATGRLAPAAGGARPAGGDPPAAGTPGSAAMPLEEMQRLLDAVSGTTGGAAAAAATATPGAAGNASSGAGDAGAVRPAPTTPFPGMVVEPDGR